MGQSESFEMLSNTDTPERKLEVMYCMKSVVDVHQAEAESAISVFF